MNPTSSSDETIFSEALARPAHERGPFLDAACAGDPARRARIESLLQMPEEAPDFMATSAVDMATSARDASAGDRIGRYKLLQKIGEGGIGVVFMAEQEEPIRRRVALKVIKLGMDTKEVIARFEAERQALALMDHPNIARVFDAAATASGRPYFVMELVRGIPITKFCDEQNLPTRARLGLFTHVCHAVQHAHQKGIIHRDLKPSNILVTLHDGVPVPKVIDFGIAKATQGKLTDATLFTAFEQFIGTPAYMSPEQAEMSGLDIDTRSDIYSLGVLLYELLTGRTPFDPKTLVNAGIHEIRRIIREVDPPRPSTRLATLNDLDRTTIARQRGTQPRQLSTLLHGDLDWIVMRCLEKDRTRRYETANGLAQDVLRHLGDEPVVARPPGVAYRLHKLFRRHKGATTAAIGIAFSLIAGTIIASWQAIRATRAEAVARAERAIAIDQRARAETASREAEANARAAETEAATSAAVNHFLQNDLLALAGPDQEPNREITLRAVLDRAAGKVGSAFPGKPLIEASIRVTLANTYYALGEYAESRRLSQRALELQEQHWGAEHPRTLNTVRSLLNTCRMLELHDEGVALGERVLSHLRRTLGSDHAETVKLMSSLAPLYVGQGRLSDAARLDAEVLAIRTRTLGREHPDTAAAISNLALVTQREGRLAEAVTLHTEALETRRRVLGPEHRDTLASLTYLAAALHAHGRSAEAAQHHAQALEIRKRTLGAEHPDTLGSMSNLAYVLRGLGRLPESVALHREALEIKRRVLGPDHSSTLTSMRYLADTLVAQGAWREAATLFEQVVENRTRVLGAKHSATLDAMNNLASVHRGQNRPGEAATIYARVLETMKEVLGPEHPKTTTAMVNLASAYRSQGKLADAASLHDDALELRKRVLGPRHPDTLESMHFLGVVWRSQRKFPAAAAILAQAWEIQKQVLGAAHRETLFTSEDLGRTLLEAGSHSEAASVLRESLAIRLDVFPTDWATALNQCELGEALVGLRQFDEGERLLADGWHRLTVQIGEINSGYRARIRAASDRLQRLLKSLGQPEKADVWSRQIGRLGL